MVMYINVKCYIGKKHFSIPSSDRIKKFDFSRKENERKSALNQLSKKIEKL